MIPSGRGHASPERLSCPLHPPSLLSSRSVRCPATRYTQEQLAGGRLNIVAEGAKKDMLQLERNLHETLPIGPQEGQKFYIQKQIEKGLTPPPYK